MRTKKLPKIFIAALVGATLSACASKETKPVLPALDLESCRFIWNADLYSAVALLGSADATQVAKVAYLRCANREGVSRTISASDAGRDGYSCRHPRDEQQVMERLELLK